MDVPVPGEPEDAGILFDRRKGKNVSRRQSGGKEAGPRGGPPRLTNLRQWILLGAVLVVAGFAVLAVLEAGLRLGGYGEDVDLFVPYGQGAPDYLVPNPSVALRYFPDPSPTQRPPSDLFHRTKPPDGLRLFVQGASTAAGFPYGYGGAFSRMLEERLARTHPDRIVEVVNTSLTGTNSYTLLDMAPEILEQQPDAVLIYAGHNEYYGVFGVGSTRLPGRVPGLVRAYLSLVRFRVLQLARSIRAGLGRGTGSRAATGTLMERLAGEQSIPFDSDLHHAGVRQFRSNLRRLLEMYRDGGVPVYIATVASNVRDQTPFQGTPEEEGEGFRRRIGEAGPLLEEGDTAQALQALDAVARRYPTAADPRFALARVLDRAGRYDSAAVRYDEARDRDRLPFRAPARMNEVIREEAGRTGATVVDVLGHLRSHSPDRIVGGALMLEHVHPNIEGQFLIADAFYERLRQDGVGGEPGAWISRDSARSRVPVTAVDSIAGAFAIQRLTAGFPFQPPGTVPRAPVDTMTSTEPAEALALEYFRGRLSWIQAQERLRSWYASRGHLGEAIHVDRVLAQELAFAPEPLLHAATMARLEGDLDSTWEFGARARSRGAGAHAVLLMAGVLASRGDTAAARSRFREVAELEPSDPQLSLGSRAFEAIPDLEAATLQRPGDADAFGELASAYYLTAQYDRARQANERALRIDPGHEGATRVRRLLGRLASS